MPPPTAGATATAASTPALTATASPRPSRPAATGASTGSAAPTTQTSPSSRSPARPPSPLRAAAPARTTSSTRHPLPKSLFPSEYLNPFFLKERGRGWCLWSTCLLTLSPLSSLPLSLAAGWAPREEKKAYMPGVVYVVGARMLTTYLLVIFCTYLWLPLVEDVVYSLRYVSFFLHIQTVQGL